MSKIFEASQAIADGETFTVVMKRYKLSKKELIQANNSIEGFNPIDTVIVSTGGKYPKGMVLAY